MLILLWSNGILFAQKLIIDSAIYNKWPTFEANIFESKSLISSDGKYVAYSVSQIGIHGKQVKQIIQSTHSNWKFESLNITGCVSFSPNGKYCLFIDSSSNLNILNLTSKRIEIIRDVANFKVPSEGNDNIFLFVKKDDEKAIVIKRFVSRKQDIVRNVLENWLSDDGKICVFKTVSENMDNKISINWIDLERNKQLTIWNGYNIGSIVLDFDFKQLAFTANKAIWHFKLGMKKPICLVRSNSSVIDSNFDLGNCRGFNQSGNFLYFYLDKKNANLKDIDTTAPEIWSYIDTKLQSVQEKEISQNATTFISGINLTNGKIIQLQKHDREIFEEPGKSSRKVLSSYKTEDGDGMESSWNSYSLSHFDLIDLFTGYRKKLEFLERPKNVLSTLSPSGAYILYFDNKQGDYYSYNVESGREVNLTKDIKANWKESIADFTALNFPFVYRGIAAWTSSGESVLIYDSHDIWKLDLSGKKRPLNVTNGFGLSHNIIFNLELNEKTNVIQENEILLMSAFNKETKDNGFFSKQIGKVGDPTKLTMGSYLYKINSYHTLAASDFTPIKARRSKAYLLRRQSATDAPNYFWTTDFKSFKQLTNIQPQAQYNWLTAELHSWKLPDGQKLQGILYKPQDFNPNRKYPVIFYYYQKLSDGLHTFLRPGLRLGANIDIPSYVSNGYIIFCPDINYEIGAPMQGTLKSIVSGAEYLSKLPFVDGTKLGLHGHSFGAIQTNYIVTHSTLFAAACSVSGSADWISKYGSLEGNQKNGYSYSYMNQFEGEGQMRMGKTLWEDLPGYIYSSPIFQVDKITTPLLLAHGKLDPRCPFPNILEFFLGLRRLGKISWMLVYPDDGHVLHGKNAFDFDLRAMQFFNHYLKGKSAPIWMSKGIKATSRAFKAGTELNILSDISSNGLLIPQEKIKVDSLINRKPITLTLK